MTAGMGIYDAMQMCRCDVSTVCFGLAASMGALILAGGAKGKRYSMPNSRIMIHQPLGGAQGQVPSPSHLTAAPPPPTSSSDARLTLWLSATSRSNPPLPQARARVHAHAHCRVNIHTSTRLDLIRRPRSLSVTNRVGLGGIRRWTLRFRRARSCTTRRT